MDSSSVFDVVVVGGGVSGLSAALSAEPRGKVLLLSKGVIEDGSTAWAQGGLAAALGDDDSVALHEADTMAAGRGLGDPKAVEILCREAAPAVERLSAWGVNFDSDGEKLLLGREAAHSRNRIVHAQGDATGREIEQALVRRLRQSSVEVWEQSEVQALLLDGLGRCLGVSVSRQGWRLAVRAGATILATGGAGQLWRHTTNPPAVAGDGIALAWEAGAEVESMEFMQFHPTTLSLPQAPHFLLTEALRGEGACVVDGRGERFLFASDERGELAPRDVVAQAIWRRVNEQEERVFLDCRPLGNRSQERFPTVYGTLEALGLRLDEDLIPITPAAHYLIGGVKVDSDGHSSVAGLFACGEVASTGVHGANRLASNSLLEGAVFGHRCGSAAMEFALQVSRSEPAADPGPEPMPGRPDVDERYLAELRDSMWQNLGIIRDAGGVASALALAQEFCEYSASGTSPLRRAAVTARLVCQAAESRRESRGAHFRADFPQIDENWQRTVVLQKGRG